MIEEFDIEKIESLDFEKLSNQLQYIFKDEQDVVTFINFLKNIQRFVNLSDDKKHTNLMELSYFKSQMQLFEKKIGALIIKKKHQQVKSAMKKAKGCGEKITENIITFYTEDENTLDGLEELHMLVSAWSAYMQDLYYICGQTNKNTVRFGG